MVFCQRHLINEQIMDTFGEILNFECDFKHTPKQCNVANEDCIKDKIYYYQAM